MQHVAQSVEPGPLLAVRLHHRPRRVGGIGVEEHRLLRRGVVVPLVERGEINGGQLPLLQGSNARNNPSPSAGSNATATSRHKGSAAETFTVSEETAAARESKAAAIVVEVAGHPCVAHLRRATVRPLSTEADGREAVVEDHSSLWPVLPDAVGPAALVYGHRGGTVAAAPSARPSMEISAGVATPLPPRSAKLPSACSAPPLHEESTSEARAGRSRRRLQARLAGEVLCGYQGKSTRNAIKWLTSREAHATSLGAVDY